MTTDLTVHPIQSRILRQLLFTPQSRFSELNVEGVSSDHFTFHLKQLVALNLVEKTDDHRYTLTTKGKEFANRFDTDTLLIERQAKIAVLVGCIRSHGQETEYLVQERRKQPYYGYIGFMTGKIRWGETVLEAAARELLEETGLTGKLALAGIKHNMDYDQQHLLLEDKYFFLIRADNVTGDLIETFEGGNNIWKTRQRILAMPDLFNGVDQTMDMLDGKKTFFVENHFTVNRY